MVKSRKNSIFTMKMVSISFFLGNMQISFRKMSESLLYEGAIKNKTFPAKEKLE